LLKEQENTFSYKRFLWITIGLICTIVIDISIVKVYDLIDKFFIPELGKLVLFSVNSSLCLLLGFFIIMHIRNSFKTHRLNKILKLALLHRISVISLFILGILMGILIFQQFYDNYYSTTVPILIIIISYGTAAGFIARLSMRFFSWYKSNHDLIVFLYFISMLLMAFNLVITPIITTVKINDRPDEIREFVGGTADLSVGRYVFLDNIYTASSLLSFISIWITTALIMNNYKRNLVHTIVYWIILFIPLFYFLVNYFYQFVFGNLFISYLTINPITVSIMLTAFLSLSKPIGGLTFALAFWNTSKILGYQKNIKTYMIISGWGILLIFGADQAVVQTLAPYPPFGLATISIMGVSSYLVLVGIYSSAISIAQDTKLRQTIRKSAIEESKLLISIGSAQMEQEIEKRAVKTAKEQQQTMAEQTGVQSSLTDHDMKQYVSGVLKEIHVLQNIDEILRKGKEILESSTEFIACSKAGGIRLVYNNYFDSYEKVMQEYSKGEHKGITLVTSIDRESVDIARKFLSIGVQIRHVKNMPPIDFAVSDKEIIATIEKMESGQMIQNLLVSAEQPYIDHFTSIFDELWKNGIDAKDRIKAIQEGVDTEGIEIIQNPAEIQKIIFALVKSAAQEILIVFATANAFHRQEYLGAMQFLKEAANRDVKIRILTPSDDLIVKTAQRLIELHEQEQESPKQQKFNIRFIEPYLQTKVSLLIVDRNFSLAVELKNDAVYRSYEAMGLATYSNSKPTVLSYVSIFESLWRQTELYEGLKEVDRLKDEFINVAAHELRTPIQPILGLSSILRSQIKDSKQQDMLHVIVRNAKRLQRLSEDILDLTKIESHNLILKKERFNMNDLISNAISDTMNQIIVKENKESSIKLEFVNSKYKWEEDEVAAIVVEADKGRISQVISNLLDNAVKFTNQGTIRVAAEKNNGDIIIRIKDTGTGIDPEILPRLFTKFTTKSNTGTGLGLFISKSIIEAHGGRIWAENNTDGKGATFYFSLPLSR